MISEFDIVFDSICEELFPKITLHIEQNELVDDKGYVDTHEILEFLTDCEGFDTDMADKIRESYFLNNKIAPHEDNA